MSIQALCFTKKTRCVCGHEKKQLFVFYLERGRNVAYSHARSVLKIYERKIVQSLQSKKQWVCLE